MSGAHELTQISQKQSPETSEDNGGKGIKNTSYDVIELNLMLDPTSFLSNDITPSVASGSSPMIATVPIELGDLLLFLQRYQNQSDLRISAPFHQLPSVNMKFGPSLEAQMLLSHPLADELTKFISMLRKTKVAQGGVF